MKKKTKTKRLRLLFLSVLVMIICLQCSIFATTGDIVEEGFTQEFIEYINLPEEERANLIAPLPYKVYSGKMGRNPFSLVLTNAVLSKNYTLQSYINKNLVVKDQNPTGACWTFATLGSIESNLAMQNLKDNNLSNDQSGLVKLYDLSEAHMEYATTTRYYTGVDPNTVKNRYNRILNGGGNSMYALSYITSGIGAVDETDMLFGDYKDKISKGAKKPIKDNVESKIDKSIVDNAEVITEVKDLVEFPSYDPATPEENTIAKSELIVQMKNYLKDNGGLYVSIHGAQLTSDYYNNDTGALYCDGTKSTNSSGQEEDSSTINHAVLLVGWDDNYPASNFCKDHRPSSNGAWIIKNSWGTVQNMSGSEMNTKSEQEFINSSFLDNPKTFREVLEQYNRFLQVNYPKCYVEYVDDSHYRFMTKIGDEGFMYVSYEDVNIYKSTFGVSKAVDNVDYDNIYQYTPMTPMLSFKLGSSDTIYLRSDFKTNTGGKEYLTHVALHTNQQQTCQAFVGKDAESIDWKKPITLKGNTTQKICDAGYHTLEFEEPIEVNGNYTVVIKAQENVLAQDVLFFVGLAGEPFHTENFIQDIKQDVSFYGYYDGVRYEMVRFSRKRTNEYASSKI